MVSVLKRIHDDIDAVVSDAYGWPSSLSDEEILSRLVDLNAKRAAEEAQGVIRWLRPEFQKPVRVIATTYIGDCDYRRSGRCTNRTEGQGPVAEDARRAGPGRSSSPLRSPRAGHAVQLAKTFLRARVDRVEELLDTLASLGQARELDDGRFVAPTIAASS